MFSFVLLAFPDDGGRGPRDVVGVAADGPGGGEGHAADRPRTAVYAAAHV